MARPSAAQTRTPSRLPAALLHHKVVFLRGQSLNYRRQVAFAERLDPLTLGHPTIASPPGQPLLEEIDSRKGGKVNYWHTDVTFVDRPPAFTLLRAVVIPPLGGETIWANTISAYQSLPGELRELADRLRVLHTNDYDYARPFSRGDQDDPPVSHGSGLCCGPGCSASRWRACCCAPRRARPCRCRSRPGHAPTGWPATLAAGGTRSP